MRIAIVNDVRMAVEALHRVVASVPDYQIAWIAAFLASVFNGI